MWPSPKNNNCIYVLKCPHTKEVRYVGLTTWGKTRINQHWKDFRLNKLGKLIKVKAWIKSLKLNNTPFLVEYIDYGVDREELNQKEMYWIAYYKSLGFNLLNGNDGGNSKNQIVTDEQKQKLSEISKKLHKDPEYVAKWKAGSKKRITPVSYKPRNEETKKIHANSEYINNQKVKVLDNNGVIYNSVKECAKILGCTDANVHRALRTGGQIKGLTVKRLNKPKIQKKQILKNNKPIVDNNGNKYLTQDEAAKKLNIDKRTVLRLLKKQCKSKTGIELEYER